MVEAYAVLEDYARKLKKWKDGSSPSVGSVVPHILRLPLTKYVLYSTSFSDYHYWLYTASAIHFRWKEGGCSPSKVKSGRVGSSPFWAGVPGPICLLLGPHMSSVVKASMVLEDCTAVERRLLSTPGQVWPSREFPILGWGAGSPY